MYLKRIELLGFKSFAFKTVLELDRGVTAVVGPNGSGKSNVVDAVRWALGEQSLRAVRSRKSEEVIFSGNVKRAPTGMAEVSLILDNADGHFPMPFAEIAVTRRQYRSGEGEYLINRSRARLKDIVELLSHASLGPDSYAVVGQGAVDEVLLQRPDERRALLEAAADISRHQAKLRESLDKLAETESNIRRVEDIRAEISPRLVKLRAQANRARRYEEFQVRLRDMLLWRYLLQIRQSRDRLSEGSGQEVQHQQTVAQGGEAAEEARRKSADLRHQLRDAEAVLDAARDRLNTLRLSRAQVEREAALRQEREASFRRQLGEAEEELGRARKERQDLETEMEALEAERERCVAQEAEIGQKMAPLDAERRRVQSEERMLRAQLERAVADQRSAAARKSELMERRNALSREATRMTTSQSESVEAARRATGRLQELDSELTAAREELRRQREGLAQLQDRDQQIQEEVKRLALELEAARRKERDAWRADNDLQNRLSMLRSLSEQHRGVTSGAKLILDARLPGIRGTLASTIRVPAEYVTAVSAALGGAQGYVVSEGFKEGLEALRFVAQRSSRATIAPLRLDRKGAPQRVVAELRQALSSLVGGIGFRGIAADLVSSDSDAQELCARYLGLSLVVDGIQDAVDLYERLASHADGRLPFQVVTMDGHVLRARGDLSTVQSGGKDVSLVARDAELAALSEEASGAAARLAEARGQVASLEERQGRLSGDAAATAAELSRLRAETEKRNAAYAELASQVGKVEAAIEWNRTRATGLDGEVAQNREAASRAEQELASVEGSLAQAASVVDQLQSDLAELQGSTGDLGARLSRLQSEQAAAQNKLREVTARASAFADGCRRAEERIARQQERVTQLGEALAQIAGASVPAAPLVSAEELEAEERAMAEASSRASRLREACDAADAQVASLAQTLEQSRDELANARSRSQRLLAELMMLLREAMRETGSELPQDEVESAAELLDLSQQVQESLRAALEGAAVEKLPQTLPEVTARVEAMRRELQAVGAINAEAPEEYKQLSERFSFMAEQLDDLGRAEKTLRSAIDDLRELMTSRFREAFDLVNAEFGRCFSILFGGGSARLSLTQPDSPLDGGVEVVATLPGKKTASLLGFSGGERSLTAVALLFAMMKVNPSPFCLLDEVDAALDESNVRRFCDMVKGLSADTQFLIITHNRTTMETAGALYGVTMEADSISKVMSLRLNGHSAVGN